MSFSRRGTDVPCRPARNARIAQAVDKAFVRDVVECPRDVEAEECGYEFVVLRPDGADLFSQGLERSGRRPTRPSTHLCIGQQLVFFGDFGYPLGHYLLQRFAKRVEQRDRSIGLRDIVRRLLRLSEHDRVRMTERRGVMRHFEAFLEDVCERLWRGRRCTLAIRGWECRRDRVFCLVQMP